MSDIFFFRYLRRIKKAAATIHFFFLSKVIDLMPHSWKIFLLRHYESYRVLKRISVSVDHIHEFFSKCWNGREIYKVTLFSCCTCIRYFIYLYQGTLHKFRVSVDKPVHEYYFFWTKCLRNFCRLIFWTELPDSITKLIFSYRQITFLYQEEGSQHFVAICGVSLTMLGIFEHPFNTVLSTVYFLSR